MTYYTTRKLIKFSLCICFSILFSFIFSTSYSQSYTIQGVEYSVCSTPETLTASFSNPAGALSNNAYRDKVLIQITGSGQSLGLRFNDAFYIYTGGPITHATNFYQLVTTIDGTVALNNNDDAYRHIVYDVVLDVETTAPYTPAYNSNHSYSFIIDMATLNPAPLFGDYENLRIGVNDGNFADNTGEYFATISQLCCPDADDDGISDCYDVCPFDPLNDYDEDGICGDVDPCPFDTNNDEDEDGLCADVDPCPQDPGNDDDEDGVCAADDNCLFDANPNQDDSDCDGIGDACDDCPGGNDAIDNSGPDGIPDGIADCSQLLDYDEYPDEWKCGNNKILVCHNDNNPHTICINKNALPAHMSHDGDYVGPCDIQECGRALGLVQFDDIENGLDFSIQPNPAMNHVSIRTADLQVTSSIRITNMLGEIIWMQELSSGVNNLMIELNPAIFPSGLYHVQIKSSNNELISKILFAH